jgi:Xaa-Pro aminopeptidase
MRAPVISKALRNLGIENKKIGIDNLTQIEIGESLRKSMPDVQFLDIAEQVGKITSIKTKEEVQLIKEACKISDEGMKTAMESLKPGIREVELASIVENRMINLGSDRMKHNSIVASGMRSKLIHPWASPKKIQHGEMVALDFGAVCGGYCSDIARTAYIGKPSEETLKVFDFFTSLEDTVLEMIRPGVSLSEIVTVINTFLKGAGYSLVGPIGHNVGLHVEERPFMLQQVRRDFTIQENMVISIFSGSLQNRLGESEGIRLENTVFVSKTGPKLLTNYPGELHAY